MSDNVVQMQHIFKSFPGVRALEDVSFSVGRGEIVGLVGENGAGKSTLMKILIGLYKADRGKLQLHGKTAAPTDPRMAARLGVGMVFQEGCLLPNLTVCENLFLCQERTFKRHGMLVIQEMLAEAEKQLAKVKVEVSPRAYVRDLPQASRQMVEIVRLIWLSNISGVENPVLILDEPTTVLTSDEIDRLFEILKVLKKECSIIFISHRLEEVLELSDRIVILKDGRNMAELRREEAEIRKVQRLMVGHELAEEYYKESEQRQPEEEEELQVEGLEKAGSFSSVSFAVRRGEIVSLVGVLGSGKEEVCRCIAGVSKADSGTIRVKGRQVKIGGPQDAIKAGIGYIPSDRREEGLALQMDVLSNITLIILKGLAKGGLLNLRKERQEGVHWVEQNRIKTPSLRTPCVNLSGGNQQKTVLAKWLATDVELLILDHPTRGIDVGAKEEIYRRIRELAAHGMAIILMSDTLEEDIGLCNRMLLMRDGQITGQVDCPANAKPAPVDIIQYIV
ncbi:MAG: sugar ABC transporter ATP-binding protein [Spirochaetales bacterium]|nr:sugar ABC transporter ATP-binding protein [Spirochaetales bacterium]